MQQQRIAELNSKLIAPRGFWSHTHHIFVLATRYAVDRRRLCANTPGELVGRHGLGTPSWCERFKSRLCSAAWLHFCGASAHMSAFVDATCEASCTCSADLEVVEFQISLRDIVSQSDLSEHMLPALYRLIKPTVNVRHDLGTKQSSA